jgi:hypothetical protein
MMAHQRLARNIVDETTIIQADPPLAQPVPPTIAIANPPG